MCLKFYPFLIFLKLSSKIIIYNPTVFDAVFFSIVRYNLFCTLITFFLIDYVFECTYIGKNNKKKLSTHTFKNYYEFDKIDIDIDTKASWRSQLSWFFANLLIWKSFKCRKFSLKWSIFIKIYSISFKKLINLYII